MLCVLQKGKEEAGPQMLRDKVEEGSWPGPRMRPWTGEGLCKSSLFEQPTKRQLEGRGQLCHRKEMDQRERAATPLLSPLPPSPRVVSNTLLTMLWILRVQPPNQPINADENEFDSSLSCSQVCWLRSMLCFFCLSVYVVTWFRYLFLVPISEALILLDIGKVSRASLSALKGSLSSSGLHPLQTENQCELPHAASSLAQPACSLWVTFSAGHPMPCLWMVEILVMLAFIWSESSVFQWGNWDLEKWKFFHEITCQYHDILASKTPQGTTSLTQCH